MKKIALLAIGMVLTISLIFSGCSDGEEYPENIKDSESVYYIVSAQLYSDSLKVKTTSEDYITVLNIEKSLTVTVDDRRSGTVLIVKHFLYGGDSFADSAELIVRTEADKRIWDREIRETLREYKEYQKGLRPRDVLPQ